MAQKNVEHTKVAAAHAAQEFKGGNTHPKYRREYGFQEGTYMTQ